MVTAAAVTEPIHHSATVSVLYLRAGALLDIEDGAPRLVKSHCSQRHRGFQKFVLYFQ